MPFISKRAFNKAYKVALADHIIPASENFITYRYGEGYNAEYGLYWPTLNKTARINVALPDGFVHISYAQETAKDSHIVMNMKDWVPA